MLLIKKTCFVAAILITAIATSQQSDKFTYKLFELEKGKTQYQQELYSAAYTSFQKAQKKLKPTSLHKEECAYYLAITAVKLQFKNADLAVENFIESHPGSNYRNRIILETANHYYNIGKAKQSLLWYETVNTKYLNEKQEDAYNYKLGYAYFTAKDYTKAKKYLLPLTRSNTYSTQASYYYGYICYIQGNYSTATKYFDKLKGNKKYQKEILYYKLNIAYQKKAFEKAVTLGNQLLKQVSKREISEISKIIGECYFYLHNYTEAIPHLVKYKGVKNKLKNEDYYFLGYSYYKTKEYQKAIDTFNKIIQGKDKVAQNAYYHLADCYLQLGKQTEALNAFKNSAELDFDSVIKEDAAYNYAKLSYQIGNPYQSSAEVLQDYVTNFSSAPNAKEVNTFIIDTYIASNDFEGGLNYYQKRNLAKNNTYYQLALNRGIQLFKNNELKNSIAYFQIADRQIIYRNTQARAFYWSAEAYYRLANYQEALTNFIQFKKVKDAHKTQEASYADYSLAYTYFKLKKYDKAKISFENYLKSNPKDKVKRNDANVRLADCYFISKSYWQAMEIYNKVIASKGVDDDYAQFQKGISYGFVKRNEQKISTLLRFEKDHPSSSYKDDALYELGKAYISAKENEKALATFEALLQKHPKSIYVSKTILKQGLIYFNTNQPEKAIEKYKYILANHSASNEAQQAVQNARQVYVDIDKVDEYAKWIKEINYASVSDIDLENAMFEAAEKKYINNEFKAATTSFKKYLLNFPEGTQVTKANFYSAQAYFNIDQKENALKNYILVAAQNANEFTEPSLARIVEIYLEEEDWTNAIPYLERLESEANFPRNILFAQSNLMKAMFDKEKYEQATIYAEKVINTPKADEDLITDATIYIARAAIKTHQLIKAKEAYAKVSVNAKGALKAEALYYKAYFENNETNYEASNKTIQTLVAEYAEYKHWGIKGLIVMAQNNIGLKDTFQATYILETVIKNYPSHTELIKEAQTLLDQIKSAEKLKEKNTETSSSSAVSEEENPTF